MNKGIKYILGFAAIFVAAVICVFGIIKYEEMQEGTTTNNSANLGSVDGKQLDKETTIIIEKLSTLNDIDALNSELHLSQAVIDILKKYAPTVSYAVDNSEGYDVIYFRLGGYYADFKVNDVNKIIGSYKVDGGKLTSTGDDLDKIGSKVNGNDKLKWNNININNKDHDKDAAFAIATKYNGVQLGGSIDSVVGLFGYLSDPSRHVKGAQLGMNVVPMSLGEITDIYNTAFAETFSAEQVYKKVTGIQHAKYREVDDSYKGNEDKYNKSVGNGEVVYFKKDKMYLAVIGGLGGVNAVSPATP
ncbi:MAG: hypothetical protein E6900_00805, partial [Gemella haemolysans]|nr:hypothetical protein [Gemella haemolysans]